MWSNLKREDPISPVAKADIIDQVNGEEASKPYQENDFSYKEIDLLVNPSGGDIPASG
jgi:hypothetical protein